MQQKHRDTCPVCGGTERRFVTDRGDKFTVESVYFCTSCGCCYLDPIVVDEEYYADDSFAKDFRGSENPTAETVGRNHVRALRRFGVLYDILEGKDVFEVGCSSGEFLDLATNIASSVHAIEPSPHYSQFAQAKGHSVETGFFPEDVSAGRYDVICTFHVLEHQDNIHKFIEATTDLLRDGGRLVIEYPDILRATRRPIITPEYFQKSHLVDFNLYGIMYLLREHGYQVEAARLFEKFPQDKNILLSAKRYDNIDDVELPERNVEEEWDKIRCFDKERAE